jgi:hypothetical protein
MNTNFSKKKKINNLLRLFLNVSVLALFVGLLFALSAKANSNYCQRADINQDGIVDDSGDLNILKNNYKRTDCSVANNWCNGADINQDGTVDVLDLGLLASNFGRNDCNVSNDWCDRTDINQDGIVDESADLGIMKDNYRRTDCSVVNNWCNGADIDQDGKVDIFDLGILASCFRRIIDNTPPVITLLGSATVDLYVDEAYTEEGATASDDVDGDISSNIVIVSQVNTGAAGNYVVTYNVSDSSGNPAEEVTRKVIVSERPVTPSVPSGGTGGNFPLHTGPNLVKGDINKDRKVDILDFNILMLNWGEDPKNKAADLNDDGKVDILDFNLLMIYWTE